MESRKRDIVVIKTFQKYFPYESSNQTKEQADDLALDASHMNTGAVSKGWCLCGGRYGLVSNYLDLLYVLGLRSDCGPFRRSAVATLLVVASVVDLMDTTTYRFVSGDNQVYYNSTLRRGPRYVVFVSAVCLIFVVGVSNEGTEKVISQYWRDVATPARRCVQFFHLCSSLLFIGIIVSAVWVWSFGCNCEFPDRSPLGEFLIALLVLVTPFLFMAVSCLCVAIREIFLKRLDDDDVSLPTLHQGYSRVRRLTDEVSDGIMYAMMLWLVPLVWVLFVRFLPRALNTSNITRLQDFFQFLVLGIVVLATTTTITYPSILIDSGDLRLREIVVHSTDINQYQILLCLFLDGDQVGLHVFDTVFHKGLLTVIFRGFYILVGIIVTQAGSAEDTNKEYQRSVIEKLDRLANQTRTN